MCGARTFWKSQKLIPSKENHSVLIAEISSCKTPKIANLHGTWPIIILIFVDPSLKLFPSF